MRLLWDANPTPFFCRTSQFCSRKFCPIWVPSLISNVVKMKIDSKPILFYKQNPTFVKIAIAFFLVGLAFRLFSSHSIEISTVVEPPPVPAADLSAAVKPLPEKAETKECDLFTGDWVPNPSGPLYTNSSCHIIEDHQNCMRNGRPDTDYQYWRWRPRDCELPKFNPVRFLDLMRNKWWGFLGDSIQRNHVQSLICILSQVEPAKEVYHDAQYKSKRWIFPSHNFTVSMTWTPFLAHADIFEDDNGVATSDIQLHLDKIDKWTNEYKNFDYVVIAGSQWFLKRAIYYENDRVVGCHYCPGKNLTELGFYHAYRKVLQEVLNFTTSLDHKAVVFFRTLTPSHFEKGEWDSGGTCDRRVPFKDREIELRDVDIRMRDIELQEVEKAAYVASRKGVVLRLLDTTRLSLLRPDGHPGPYRQFYPFAVDKNAKVQYDCLHWCLPGPIDSWNDVMMEILVNG